jgi:hypothetical protein
MTLKHGKMLGFSLQKIPAYWKVRRLTCQVDRNPKAWQCPLGSRRMRGVAGTEIGSPVGLVLSIKITSPAVYPVNDICTYM